LFIKKSNPNFCLLLATLGLLTKDPFNKKRKWKLLAQAKLCYIKGLAPNLKQQNSPKQSEWLVKRFNFKISNKERSFAVWQFNANSLVNILTHELVRTFWRLGFNPNFS